MTTPADFEHMLNKSVVHAKAKVVNNSTGVTLFRKNGIIFKIENDTSKVIQPRTVPGAVEIDEAELHGYLDKIIEFTDKQKEKWGAE